MIRILLVDDQNIVRQGIQVLLEPISKLKVVGTAQDGNSAIEQVGVLMPHIVLMDIEMSEMNGITATQKICEQFPETKVIVLSSHEDCQYITQALHAGAESYVLKNTLAEDLVQTIWSVYKGRPQIESKLLKGTDPYENTTSDSRLGKTLIGLGVFALVAGNILIVTNYIKPLKSMVIASGIDISRLFADETISAADSSNYYPVRVETIKFQTLKYSVSCLGSVKPYQEIVVYPRIEGQLTNYSVYPGSRITIGEAIATLDTVLDTEAAKANIKISAMEATLSMSKIEVDEQQAQIEYIEADLSYLNSKKDLLTKSVENGVVSQNELDVVNSQVKNKEATLNQSQVKLAQMLAKMESDRAKLDLAKAKVDNANVIRGYTTITSPISGIVQERNVDLGTIVKPTTGVVKIGDYNRVRLQADIAQTDAVNIRPGAKVSISIPNTNVPPITAEITSMFLRDNSQPPTAMVEAIVDNPNGQFVSEQLVEMEIVIHQSDAITIPQAAVVQFQEQPSVWLVEGDRVKRQALELGMSTKDRVEVIRGLTSGATIVTSGQEQLVENATVEIIN